MLGWGVKLRSWGCRSDEYGVAIFVAGKPHRSAWCGQAVPPIRSPFGAGCSQRPRPDRGSLEAEHRVEDVERQHRAGCRCCRRFRRSNPAGHGARLVDASSRNLTFLVLAVEHHLILVDGLIQLDRRRNRLGQADGTCLPYRKCGPRQAQWHDARAQFLALTSCEIDPPEGPWWWRFSRSPLPSRIGL